MSHGKWRSRLCPVSFALALGITAALAVLIVLGWYIYHGAPPEITRMHPELLPLTWSHVGIIAFWTFVKGLIFGFFLALIYDLISCCCKSAWCCKKSVGCGCGCKTCAAPIAGAQTCQCGCQCCSPDRKNMNTSL